MQYKYIRTLRAPVKSDSQDLRVSDMISDLCLCLLPGFLFSTSFMTIVNDVPSAVVILSNIFRENKLLAVFCLCFLSVADAIIRICKYEFGLLLKHFQYACLRSSYLSSLQ